MARRPAPLWLAVPTRFAGLDRRRAQVAAILFLLFLAIGLGALAAPLRNSAGDPSLYDGVVAGLRAGGDYYELTAQALRAEGAPLTPFTAFRLPTHAVVQAALPPVAIVALLYLLAIGVACAWWVRLRAILIRTPARLSAAILLAVGLAAVVQAGPLAFHGLWAGLLVALTLAIRTPGRWATSVALGLIAMLVRETAVLLVLVMAFCAWREGAMREAAAWGIALLAFALVMTAHAWGVAGVIGPLDPSGTWVELNDAGVVVRAMVAATALQALPSAVAVLLTALAVFGWAAWRDPLADRMLLFIGCAVATALFADPTSAALMVAPVLLVGVAFAPDGLRDLSAVLLDRRRVRVQRISQ